MKEKYIPINCDFYDEIEILAMRRTKCKIVYQNKENEVQTIEGIINDVYAKNKEEFLIVNKELKIRLDQLISIDDKMVPKAC